MKYKIKCDNKNDYKNVKDVLEKQRLKTNELENKQNRYFHVTPIKNLEPIYKNGLKPAIGPRSLEYGEQIEAVYLFPNFENLNTALGNWLGECFDEDEELVILQIDLPENFPIIHERDNNGDLFYEAISKFPISSEYITETFSEYYDKIDVDIELE